LSSWMSLMRNGAVLVAWAVYLLGQRRKKKVIHAMLAVAMVPTEVDMVAMVSVWQRILREIGWTWDGVGLAAWKPWQSCNRQKSIDPRPLSWGSGVPSRASIWPTKCRACSTVWAWTGHPCGASQPVQYQMANTWRRRTGSMEASLR